MLFSAQDILEQFKGLSDVVDDIPDDNYKFTFIDRCAEYLSSELGWLPDDATNLAMAINYNVTEEAIELPEYDEIEKCFFDVLVKVIRRYQKRFPDATLVGFISAASSMEFELKI